MFGHFVPNKSIGNFNLKYRDSLLNKNRRSKLCVLKFGIVKRKICFPDVEQINAVWVEENREYIKQT